MFFVVIGDSFDWKKRRNYRNEIITGNFCFCNIFFFNLINHFNCFKIAKKSFFFFFAIICYCLLLFAIVCYCLLFSIFYSIFFAFIPYRKWFIVKYFYWCPIQNVINHWRRLIDFFICCHKLLNELWLLPHIINQWNQVQIILMFDKLLTV